MDNLSMYSEFRIVPPEAKREIKAGRLKGMTDINPMWRIKRLTEKFGPCGIGWWYDILRKWIETDEITQQKAGFVDINLYYVDPNTWETSKPIPGTGGASFVSQERNGPYLSDEVFKMALTDAISVSCKALGLGADVYFEEDKSKYFRKDVEQEAPKSAQKTTAPPEKKPDPLPDVNAASFTCSVCGKVLKPLTKKGGEQMSIREYVGHAMKKFGQPICFPCVKENYPDAYANQEWLKG